MYTEKIKFINNISLLITLISFATALVLSLYSYIIYAYIFYVIGYTSFIIQIIIWYKYKRN